MHIARTCTASTTTDSDHSGASLSVRVGKVQYSAVTSGCMIAAAAVAVGFSVCADLCMTVRQWCCLRLRCTTQQLVKEQLTDTATLATYVCAVMNR
jgi:hypothetical protein